VRKKKKPWRKAPMVPMVPIPTILPYYNFK
jgi:hypothetical protein